MKALSFPLLIFCMMLAACGDTSMKGYDKAAPGNHLTSFKGLPPGIDGCSCYFSDSEEDFKEEQFLFAANYEDQAFVWVNNTLVSLELRETSRASGSFGDSSYHETYTDGTYTVTIEVNFKEGNGDETWWNTGSISLYFKGELVETRSFVGECGC